MSMACNSFWKEVLSYKSNGENLLAGFFRRFLLFSMAYGGRNEGESMIAECALAAQG